MFAVIIALSAAPLVAFKYSSGVIMPLGISFFTFKSISYLADIQSGKITADKNFVRVFAFIAFFPELIAGPIDRADNLLVQMQRQQQKDASATPITWSDCSDGIVMLLGGLFLKTVIADRIAILVNNVYSNLYVYEGITIVIAVALYSIQIYCDFAGCSYMAIGVGRMLGYSLPDNFRQPYLATTVAEFWRRWHMSLMSWLKDYIYISLGGSRKGKLRKNINVMVVFLISGIWHGADFSFILWGGINGLMQVIGTLLSPLRSRIETRLCLDDSNRLYKWHKRLWVYIFISFTWIFFRADNISRAILVFKKMFTRFNPWILVDGSLYELGLNSNNLHLLTVLIVILVIVDILHEKGISLRKSFASANWVLRGAILLIVAFAIIIFGIYGPGYDAGRFIYMDF